MPPDWGAVLFGTPPARPGAAGPSPTVQAVQQKIIAEARRQGVKPALALGIAQAESSFNPNAVGDNGRSIGLFQLQPAAAQDVGLTPQDRYDVDKNITGGIAYLKNRIAREGGDENRGIAAYNQGIGWRGGQYSNPQYVQTVRRYQQHFQQQPAVLAATRPAAVPAPVQRPSPRPAAPPQRDWSRELGETAMPPPARDWGQELFGTPTGTPATPAPSPVVGTPPGAGPAVPQAPQAPWWQQAAGSAARTASRGILGGLPELAGPAAQRLTDPQQIPETAAGVGEMVGQQVGSAVMPGPGTAVGGVMGAVGGLTAGTLATEGRLPTWKELGREAVWSAVPEVAESGLRSLARHIGRGTQGGRLIRLDEAARRARDLPGVFQAQSRQQVGQAFDAVRASGVQLDVGPMRQEVQVLNPEKYQDLLAEVQRIDRANRTGRRYEQIVERLRQGGGVQLAGLPIGDLQQLRSHLRTRAEELTSHEARQLVENFQGAVDDAIDQGIARGRVPTGMTVQDLQEARRQWARVRAHEDLSTLVERSITVNPNLTMSSLNLRQMADALRRNEGPLARRVNRALDHTPGARAAFQREMDDVAQLFQTVEVPIADVFGIWRAPGFAAFRQAISATLATETGRQIFREAIINGRGRLSVNALAAAVNAARRESGLDLPEIPGLEEEPRAGGTSPTTPAQGG